MNTNEVITNLALEYLGYAKGRYDIINPNDHVNKSQSTNDAYPTGFRLGLFTLVGSLIEELERLIAAMRAKGAELVHVLKMGRTQLQDAVPMSLGQEFEAFAVLLEEEVSRLHNNAALLLEVNLGATAIGTGLNTPPDYQRTVDRGVCGRSPVWTFEERMTCWKPRVTRVPTSRCTRRSSVWR